MIPEEEEEEPDPADQETLVFESEESVEEPFNTTVDTTSDDSTITMGKPVTTAFISDQVRIPTEQVGCLQVTSQLQEFLDPYPPKSIEKAFEHTCHALQMMCMQQWPHAVLSSVTPNMMHTGTNRKAQ